MAGTYDDDIVLLAASLSVGERSSHLICPACQGGAGREQSLLIWSDPGSLMYKCLRVSCGLFGRVGDNAFRGVTKTKRVPRKHTKLLSPEVVPDDVQDWLCNVKFPWLRPEQLYLNGVQWDDNKERLLLPIKSLTGFDEGFLARRYDELVLESSNLGGPKASAYFNTLPEDYQLTSLMSPRNAAREDVMVVYEDFWSCLRSNAHVPSCALSGTSLQEAALLNIIKARVKHVIFVLDADAIAKAQKLVQNNRLLFRSMSFIPLTGPDPKDMTYKQMQVLLDEITERLYGTTNNRLGNREPPGVRNLRATRKRH